MGYAEYGTLVSEFCGGKPGEIWFAASDEVPLLVKLLLTSANLSVQVHPGDDYAKRHENSLGKTEMWHILRADPRARVALGLREGISTERLREAALSGEIDRLLNWVPAHVGDTFFVPAGTIHAIGGGLVLCEVQQKSDVTYRLFDYGRGRELHLDASLAVANREPYTPWQAPVALSASRTLLAECGYFRTERLSIRGAITCPSPARSTIYVVLEGEGRIAGQQFRTGEAWEAPSGCEAFEINSAHAAFLIAAENR